MARRLKPTLIDYLVIAINPALIMLLVGSLVYFLLELFYQGQYPERLHYCLSLFIFGVVLISRISMEEGWEHAAPFGAALAVVVALAMHRFVNYAGSNLAEIGWLINYFLMAITWSCAHQLTWDCTLMDETQDASGEGLLQTVGIDTEESADSNTIEDGRQSSDKEEHSSAVEPITSWWQTMIERRRRPHAPGVWVVYFSLAALPLFGIGQAFIPASNEASRRYAFVLLCVYVACALGLLLTTSFLGLRRYLRQRRLEMPAPMASTWLTIGVVLIFALLLFAALLPRPSAEFSISHVPFQLSSEQRAASEFAAGKEGTRDDEANPGQGRDSGEQAEELKAGGKQDAQKSDNAVTNKDGKSEAQSDPRPGGPQSDQDESEAKPRGEPQDSPSRTSGKQEAQTNSDSGAEENAAQSQQASQTPPPIQPPPVASFMAALAPLLKLLFYGVLVLLVAWWGWRHRTELLAWLQNLLSGWRDFWKNLFRRGDEVSEAIVEARKRKAFAEYPSPYRTGMADRWSVEELVRYTFEAVEAYARDQGWPREADQTAYEFARQAGSHDRRLAIPLRHLADLYSRAAYADGPLPAASASHLRKLWEVLEKETALA